MYNFTNTWFERSELKQYLNKFLDPIDELTLLEIGVYEGAFSCFLSDII